MIYTLETAETLVVAILALFIGVYLTNKVQFLGRYNIPVPVSGGLVISLLIGFFYVFTNFELKFSLGLRDFLLLAFFATVGLSAKIRQLIEGGRLLAILMGLQAKLLPLDLSGIKGKKRQQYFAAVRAGVGRDYKPMERVFSDVVRRSRRAASRAGSGPDMP